jgi:hypothetical protein
MINEAVETININATIATAVMIDIEGAVFSISEAVFFEGLDCSRCLDVVSDRLGS